MAADLSKIIREGYDQGVEIRRFLGGVLRQRSDVYGGICLSLCMNWIQLHREYHKMGKGEKYRKESMKNRIKGLMCEQVPFSRALNSQSWDYGRAFEKSDAEDDHLDMIGSKYGMSFKLFKKTSSLQADTRLKEQMLAVNRAHEYAVTVFNMHTDDGVRGHAICSYKSGGKMFGIGSHLYAFDPNYGEFRVPTGSIVDFYDELFKLYKDCGDFPKEPRTYIAKFRAGSYF